MRERRTEKEMRRKKSGFREDREEERKTRLRKKKESESGSVGHDGSVLKTVKPTNPNCSKWLYE